MTHTVTFPSDAAPAFPSIELTLPDDWQPLSVSGAVLAAGKTVEQGEFRPNVVVAVTRFAAGYELGTAVDGVLKRVESIDGVAEIGRDEPEVLGRPGFRIEFSYPDPRVGGLVQAVRIAVVDHGAAVDLVQVTATATAGQAEAFWGELRDVQSSARLAEPVAAV